MSVSINKWVTIDRIIKPAYRILHYVAGLITPIRDVRTDEVIVIKLFGLGSIVRLVDMCEDSGVDISKITIVTSSSHKELCELCGLKAILIDTSSVLTLGRGCLNAISAVERIQPRIIVDFERCSNLVGILRTIMAWRTGCRTLSFERRSLDTPKSVVHSVDKLSQQEIFNEGIKHFPAGRKRRTPSDISVDNGKIIINVNASDLLESRRYDLLSFATAIRSIHQEYPAARFYFSGVRSEQDYVQRLADQLSGLPVQNVAGEWSLERLMRELSDCELLITVDSAPLHLGKYLNVTTLSLWGPTQPSHFGYSTSPRFQTLSLGMHCSPCFLHPLSKPAVACKGAITCMRQLSPEAVAIAAVGLLSRSETVREVNIPVNLRLAAADVHNVVG